MDLEGANVAHRLNQMGIAAFVLKSRLAHTPGFNYRVDVESLQDAHRAIRTCEAAPKSGISTPKRSGSWASPQAVKSAPWPKPVSILAILIPPTSQLSPRRSSSWLSWRQARNHPSPQRHPANVLSRE
jgi:hypothetical protein